MSGAVFVPVVIGVLTYRLVFKFGTMRIAERELGNPITDELTSGSVSLDVLSCLFWAALQPGHRMTREASDDLIDSAGIEQVGKWIGEGVTAYFGVGKPGLDEQGAEPGESPGEAVSPARRSQRRAS